MIEFTFNNFLPSIYFSILKQDTRVNSKPNNPSRTPSREREIKFEQNSGKFFN